MKLWSHPCWKLQLCEAKAGLCERTWPWCRLHLCCKGHRSAELDPCLHRFHDGGGGKWPYHNATGQVCGERSRWRDQGQRQTTGSLGSREFHWVKSLKDNSIFWLGIFMRSKVWHLRKLDLWTLLTLPTFFKSMVAARKGGVSGAGGMCVLRTCFHTMGDGFGAEFAMAILHVLYKTHIWYIYIYLMFVVVTKRLHVKG